MEKWCNNHYPSLFSIESCISLSRHSMSVIASWLSKFWSGCPFGARMEVSMKPLLWRATKNNWRWAAFSCNNDISLIFFSKVLVGEAFGARVSLQVSHLSRKLRHCHHHHCHHPNHNHLRHHHFQASVNEYLSDHSPRRLIFSEEVR